MLGQTPFVFSVYFLMISSTIFVAMSPNWLMAWIMLEVNMLSFIPFIMKTKSNQETEASIKYFLAQALGSMMMLLGMSMLSQSINQELTKWVIIIAMFIKLGMAPCHFWYPSVMAALSWISCMVLSTWQKLAPLILLMTATNSMKSTMLLSMLAGTNALVGGVIGMNQTHLRPLLAYSSIGHMGWMMSMMCINKMTFCMTYFIMYTMIIMPIFTTLNMMNTKTVKSLFMTFKTNMLSTLMLAMCMMSLAGIPPLTGFMPKLMIITQLMSYNSIMLIMLLIGAYMNLYYYLNITFNILMSSYMSLSYMKMNKFIPAMLTCSTTMLGAIPLIL